MLPHLFYFIVIKIDNFLNNFEGSKIHIARVYDGFFLRQSLAPRDEHARLRTRGNHGDNDMLHQLDSDGDQSRVRSGYNLCGKRGQCIDKIPCIIFVPL